MTPIRDANEADAARIAEIYGHYVQNTTVTFEIVPPTTEEIARRIRDVQEKHVWLLAEEKGTVLGYAYAASFKERAAYRFSAEITVYVDIHHSGKGIGSALLEELLERLRHLGFVHAIGVIALPNPGSVRLHEKFGFKKAAHFSGLGYKLGNWIDVGYWQKQIQPFFSDT